MRAAPGVDLTHEERLVSGSTLSYEIIEGSTDLSKKKLRFQTRVIFAKTIEKTLIFYRLALTKITFFRTLNFVVISVISYSLFHSVL